MKKSIIKIWIIFILSTNFVGHINAQWISSFFPYLYPTTGNQVGIGTTTPVSTVLLDLVPPALNNAYGLNDTTVLQNWGINNIFCGVGTGFSNISTNTSNGGYSNAFFGYNAGYSNEI